MAPTYKTFLINLITTIRITSRYEKISPKYFRPNIWSECIVVQSVSDIASYFDWKYAAVN